ILGGGQNNRVSLLLGSGDGTFGGGGGFDLGGQLTAQFISRPLLITGDFNGDGRTDVATANFESSNVSVLLGPAAGKLKSQVTLTTADAPHVLAAADFNGDGRTDLVAAGVAQVAVFLGLGDGNFSALNKDVAGLFRSSPLVARINDDTAADLVSVNI